MKVSLNWLNDYVTTGISPEKLAHRLTMAGLEVEKVSLVGGDSVFELEVTPNRPDCLSVLGVARETAAILGKARKFPQTKKRSWPKQKSSITISDTQGCSRYIGTVIENVVIAKAQKNITKRLAALGMKPINNVVDITNFCLMETGQPLHAFDYDKLVGGTIIVRKAKKGEKIVTIDGVERKLDPSILVIADEKRPVAIAGIMGGQGTEVTMATKNIFLESAYFDPVLIRRASRKLGLSSDSSYRFERGVDYNMVEGGSNRAIDLILQSAGGNITSRFDKALAKKRTLKQPITVSKNQINERIGASLTAAQCKSILTKLDFKVVSAKSDTFKVTPPPFRNDINEFVDIVEEIARIVGYDNLPSSFPQIKTSHVLSDPKRDVRRCVSGMLIAQGLNEVITYTMINRKNLARSNQANLQGVAILNPLTQDQEILRPSMLPGFLSILLSNINRGQKNIKYFEMGKIYTAKGEKDVLGVVMTGSRSDDWRQIEKKKVDYYDLKGVIERIFERISDKTSKIGFEAAQEGYFALGQSATIMAGGKQIGVAGKVEEGALEKWGIKQEDVFFAQIELESIYHREAVQQKYRPISEFPTISRDISLAVNQNVTAMAIEKLICKTVHEKGDVVLADVKFVELYEGNKIAKDRRGLMFSLTYQSRLSKTLRDEEAEEVHRKVCSTLINDLGVIQR